MDFKKRVNGAWTNTPIYEYGDGEYSGTVPVTLLTNGVPISSGVIKGNMSQQSGTTNVPSKNVTVSSLEANTNYAMFAKADFPNIAVGDSVSVVVSDTTYSQKVMKIDASYVYIENRTV